MESVKDAVKDRPRRRKTPRKIRKIRCDRYMQWAICLMEVSQCGNRFLPIARVHLEPSQKFTMKSSIVNDRLGSKYTSALAYC